MMLALENSQLCLKETMKTLNSLNVLLIVCLCFLTACENHGGYRYSRDQMSLMKAISGGRVKEVKRLVKSDNVNINLGDNGFGTLLKRAADRGNVEIIEILLDHGARINQRDAKCFTPLMNAVRAERPAAVKILLKRGADISLEVKMETENLTALDLAKLTSNQEIIDILESAAKAKKQEFVSKTEKQKAC